MWPFSVRTNSNGAAAPVVTNGHAATPSPTSSPSISSAFGAVSLSNGTVVAPAATTAPSTPSNTPVTTASTTPATKTTASGYYTSLKMRSTLQNLIQFSGFLVDLRQNRNLSNIHREIPQESERLEPRLPQPLPRRVQTRPDRHRHRHLPIRLPLRPQRSKKSRCPQGGKCDMTPSVVAITSTTTTGARLGSAPSLCPRAGRCDGINEVAYITWITTRGQPRGKGQTQRDSNASLAGRENEPKCFR